MMKKQVVKRVLSAFAALSLTVALMAGCGGNQASQGSASTSDQTSQAATESKAEAADDTVYEIKIANTVSETDPINLGYNIFKEEIESASNGRFKVTIYPAGTLAGTDTECLEKVNTHVIQLASTPPNTFDSVSTGFSEAAGLQLVMLCSSDEELYKLDDSEFFQNMFKEFEEKTGIKVYGSFVCGWVMPSLDGKQVTSMEDFKGQKIRLVGQPSVLEFYKELGFTTVNVAFNETFAAIQQGMVSGLFTPLNLYITSGFWEVVDSIGVYNCTSSFHEYVVDGSWYDSLPEDLQKIFDDCMVNLEANTRRLEKEAVEQAADTLTGKGITLYYPTEEELAYMEEVARTKIWPNEELTGFKVDSINQWLTTLGKDTI